MDANLLGFNAMVFFILAMTLISYFSPTLIAHARKHHNLSSIFVVNFCLGWTFFGWIAAMAWAVSNNQKGN